MLTLDPLRPAGNLERPGQPVRRHDHRQRARQHLDRRRRPRPDRRPGRQRPPRGRRHAHDLSRLRHLRAPRPARLHPGRARRRSRPSSRPTTPTSPTRSPRRSRSRARTRTITFNDPALVGLEGGIATGIDWRDLDISGSTTLTARSGPRPVGSAADSAGVNVNNLLGSPASPRRPAPTSSACRPRSPPTSSATSRASSTVTRSARSAPGFTPASTPTSTIRPIPARPTPTRRSGTSWPRATRWTRRC